MPTINIYCDESCHLEHDRCPVMSLGALWCPADRRGEITRAIRELKAKHNLSQDMEIKWTKVSPGGQSLYKDLVDFFFDTPELHFRAVVVPDKAKLNHEVFAQDHDTFYYKLYFYLLTNILEDRNAYRIYIDIKDTRGNRKVEKLHEVLCNAHLDFDRRIIERVQQVRSHEVELLQLADLLLGAVTYGKRGLTTSKTKTALVDLIRRRGRLSLGRSTLPSEKKFNLFIWRPQEKNDVVA